MKQKLLGFDVEKKWDYENGFYLTSHLTRLPKMLAHYEIYKSIVNLPGQIVECGVFKGTSLIRFCTFREVLESPFSRKIIGFDIFGKFPKKGDVDDAAFIEKFERDAGDGISVTELKQVFSHKGFENYELVKGDIIETVPDYAEAHPELKIALLHIDVDVYEPSMVVLQHLYDRVVKGGVIIFDDYGTVAGETKAIDEFFCNKDVEVEKLPISHIPAYIRKK